MRWSQASLNQTGSLEVRRRNELLGDLSGTLPPPPPHSHLVQHIGYGPATAQVLGAGTGGWDRERLQLWGRAKRNRQRQDLGSLNQSPSADFSSQQELNTVELER